MNKRILLLSVLVIAISLATCGSAIAMEANETLPDGIFLHTESPLILSNNQIKALDPENLDVAATVVKSRTLIPLRAISEYFGASVSYDKAANRAIVKYQDKQYIFPINEPKYIVAGQPAKIVKLDTKSLILNNRIMLPFRVISEDILGKKVSYHNGVIAIADQTIDLSQQPELINKVKEKIGTAVKVNSKAELRKAFSESLQWRNDVATDSLDKSSTVQDNQAVKETAGGYAETNVQVAGIDEADIIKTDGKYIYLCASNAIRIVRADANHLSEAATIRLPLTKYVNEIYVDGNRLVILGTKTESGNGNRPFEEAISSKIMPEYHKSFSFMDIYDISNAEKPVFLKSHEMQGSYQSSRKNNDIVYMITSSYIYGDDILPLMKDSVAGNKATAISLNDVMIMPRLPASGYLVVSAVNINNNQKTEVEAIAASGYIFYMNKSSLYVAGSDYNGATSIIKFHLNGTNVGYAGSGMVKGDIINQFAMDEQDGYLRVATSTWENGNYLYVLDDSLNVCGSVAGFAKGERIYSVRYLGDKGYIVTFRTIDPLFVFDLSNPKEPKITGELKVPGFSSYLHPVGEDLILGIGQETVDIYQKDANGKEIVVGTRTGGIKFSLFDVSNMGKPRELANYVLGTTGSYAEALNNHKAVMVDSESKNLAIVGYITTDAKSMEAKQQAIIMNYDQKKLKLKGTLEAPPATAYGSNIPYGGRVLYIDDKLFYIQDNMLVSYNYSTLNLIDKLELQ
ncbi:MAG: beta-propeller domain-containing protein [Bacillota bacterium]|jgi:inhibitor of cysteine peptidase